MNLNFSRYYFARYTDLNCPQWVAAERYDFCESFHGIFSLLSRRA